MLYFMYSTHTYMCVCVCVFVCVYMCVCVCVFNSCNVDLMNFPGRFILTIESSVGVMVHDQSAEVLSTNNFITADLLCKAANHQ